LLNVVEVPAPSESAQFPEMGLLFPVPGIEKNTIVMEERDGPNVQRLTATEVVFKVGAATKFKDRKVKIDLFVTDARFALACSGFDKGGGHSFFGGGGALFLDVAVNSVSKARAKMRSRGRMLVGQVRYPWLHRVGSSPKAGFGTKEKLYFEMFVKGGGTTTLTLILPSNVSAAQVAAEAARRAARFRLVTKNPDGDLKQTLEAMASVEAIDGGNAREIAWHTLPGADFVDETSARLSPTTF
jgi:Tfp pilus assembly major pilin PilA